MQVGTPFRVLVRAPLFGWLCGMLLFAPLMLRAAPSARLYEAEVPASGQDATARNKAIRAALQQVLVKVSGNRKILRRPGIARELDKASRLVQQYRFRVMGAGEGAATRLNARFDADAINRLLRRHHLPVWGTRPAVLAWLAVDREGRRRFLSRERFPRVYASMKQTARKRGLTLLFPLLDLQDRRALKATDLWDGFGKNIRTASQRYVPDVILTGRLEDQGGAWRGQWSLLQQSGAQHWETRAKTAAAVVEAGMDNAVDRLAQRYAPILADEAGDEVLMRVIGLDSLPRYVRVSRYLQALDLVDQVGLQRVAPTDVVFALRSRGGEEALARAIAIGGLLVPEPVAEMSSAGADVPSEAEEGGASGEEDAGVTTTPLAQAPTLNYRLR